VTELLLLGCSDRKTKAPEPTPALWRYDGPIYQDFRAHLRNHRWPQSLDVAVLSAEFGLIGVLTEIQDYDRRMTRDRANELAPALTKQIETWSAHYSSINLCLGKDYLATLPTEQLPHKARFKVFEGPIGIKRQKLGNYLRDFDSGEHRAPTKTPVGRLSYFLPDWDDLVDPDFDFATDTYSALKQFRDERHCARIMRPFKVADGILVSLAQKRDSKGPLKYVGGLDARTMRPFDLRAHYGLDPTQALFGDCGAFSYVNEKAPPFSADYVVSQYDLYNFDFGASIDHIPLPEIVVDGRRVALSERERRNRVALTTSNAEEFIRTAKRRQARFIPVGVVQGLSAKEMASNARLYAEMGYKRIALGGLVPLPDDIVREVVTTTMTSLRELRNPPEVHLFGIFRPKLQALFKEQNVCSFDSATYFRKAWLRSEQNYLAPGGNWYAAIRVPMTADGRTRNQLLSNGGDIEKLKGLESAALTALHEYGQYKTTLKATLEAVITYDKKLARSSEDISLMKDRYQKTLADRPWEHCGCPVCQSTGIDVLIFRGSNRNKRRGIHNTWHLYNIIRGK